ncbi:hypothetical protein ALC57_03398 [Trachymyrmex cornetzi]|uniref:Uncharacterized protein n=1 Tax=Trachymyrmex cornetzi TaxID=471704 RepID=A0A195EFW7_9HYME|nr:hypothetical protein ALC57_03398 [Trachymyrmex cornetzi]
MRCFEQLFTTVETSRYPTARPNTMRCGRSKKRRRRMVSIRLVCRSKEVDSFKVRAHILPLGDSEHGQSTREVMSIARGVSLSREKASFSIRKDVYRRGVTKARTKRAIQNKRASKKSGEFLFRIRARKSGTNYEEGDGRRARAQKERSASANVMDNRTVLPGFPGNGRNLKSLRSSEERSDPIVGRFSYRHMPPIHADNRDRDTQAAYRDYSAYMAYNRDDHSCETGVV